MIEALNELNIFLDMVDAFNSPEEVIREQRGSQNPASATPAVDLTRPELAPGRQPPPPPLRQRYAIGAQMLEVFNTVASPDVTQLGPHGRPLHPICNRLRDLISEGLTRATQFHLSTLKIPPSLLAFGENLFVKFRSALPTRYKVSLKPHSNSSDE